MKQITYDQEASQKIKDGIDKLANAVKSTLGPGGSNVILDLGQTAHITKDGVTVANFISLEDPIENLGAQVVKEAAIRTANLAGDGTTTATVLAQAIFSQGIKNVVAGANRIDLKRGIDMATKAIVSELKNLSRPVSGNEDIRNVALISANGDNEVADIITEAIDKVTKDGLVIVQDSRNASTEVRVVEGMTFDRGYLNASFVTNEEEMVVEYEQPMILLIDYVIEEFAPLIRIINLIKAQHVEKAILIIAEDIRGNALSTMALNNHRGVRMCAVQSPDFGEMRKETLKDLAALTGATIITKDEGLTTANVGPEVCGTCSRIRISQWKTTIFGGLDVSTRLEVIKAQMEQANEQALMKLKDRYARLTGRIGVIYVGGNSEIEVKEKKDRIDDALQATRAAIEEGILPGGGVAYVRALQAVREGKAPNGWNEIDNDDQLQGTEILFRAILEPIRCIAENVGVNGEVVLNQVNRVTSLTDFAELGKSPRVQPNYGFNAKTHQYGDMILDGVIDPTKVTRLALENAASVAGMLLTTKAVVTNAKPQVRENR